MKKIILIVGASGVGKDTLIKYARKKMKKEINFVRRYITRKPDKNEKNFFVDNSAFKVLKDNNFFVSSWSAHENLYGIAKSSIKEGVNVISISRKEIEHFESIYNNVTTINITVPKNILKVRLISRGRETKEEIKKRLLRDYGVIKAKKIVEFENILELTISVEIFTKLLGDL